jgi:predicted RNA binding protein YcfA (HicA-like mRNA interferase family)
MRLTPISSQKLIKILAKIGYLPVRQKGSHLILENAELNKITVIPIHNKPLGIGLLSMILKEVGLSRDEYFKLLEEI